MTSQQDQPNPSRQSSLFDAAPASFPEQISRLTAELEQERKWRLEMEFRWREADKKLCAYRNLDAIYSSLKMDAERAAQAPIDNHYRQALDVLYAIASDRSACTCHVRSWHGEGHD